MGNRILVFGALLLLSLPATVFADPGVELEIAEVTARLEAAPQAPGLLVRRADLRRRVGRFDDALRDLALAEATAHELGPVYLVRARIFVDRGDDSAALRLLESALPTMGPAARAEAQALVAHIHEEAGRVDDAVVAYDAALDLRDDVDLYLSRGRLLVFAGRPTDAIAGYEAGVEALAGAAVLRLELAELLIAGGAPDRALVHANALIAQSRATSRWLVLRARAHESMGRTDLATRDREAALSDAERVLARRRSATARLGRARALLALGRTDEAVHDLRRVVSRAPQLTEARVLLHRFTEGGAR